MSTFNQDYANDTGFTYDSDLAEFAAGKVQQKSTVPADVIAYASYTDNKDFNYSLNDVLTGTLVLDAAIKNGALDMSFSNLSYAEYEGDGIVTETPNEGCIRTEWEASFTGDPGEEIAIYTEGTFNQAPNRVNISVLNGGYISVKLYDSASVLKINSFTLWSPVAGQKYDIELNFSSGSSAIYIDGVRFGSVSAATFTRSSTIPNIYVGGQTSNTNGKIHNFARYDAIQHTEDFTPTDWSEFNETKYVESKVDLPTATYTGPGNLIQYSAFESTDANDPKYIINGKYWNGSAFITSNGTYLQASTITEINTNITSLTAADTLDLSVVFDDGSVVMSVDDTTTTYVGDPLAITLEGFVYDNDEAVNGQKIEVRPYPSGFNTNGVFCKYLYDTIATTNSEGKFSGSILQNPSGYYWQVKIDKQSYKIDLSSFECCATVDFNEDIVPEWIEG